MAKVLDLIWGVRKPKYFFTEDWTTQIRLKSLNKSPRTRDGFGLLGWPIRGPDAAASTRLVVKPRPRHQIHQHIGVAAVDRDLVAVDIG